MPALHDANADLEITEETNYPRWDGQAIAYHDVVGQLSYADQGRYIDHPLYGSSHAEVVSAETVHS